MGDAMHIRGAVLLLAIVLAAGCGGPARPSAGSGQPAQEGRGSPRPQVDQSRTLVIAARFEPTTLTQKALVRIAAASDNDARSIFNAGLAVFDDQGVSRPQLAEALPELNTDSWRVLPDGRMETTYRLRPNLTWQDGTALTAEDFAFAWRVYATPELGVAGSPPIAQMEEVRAPDARTVLIRWKQPFPDANILSAEDFQALPRHVLEDAYQRDHSEAFGNLPFWTIEYLGLGPYRIDRWEPGAFLEGAAFPGYALGSPKIQRIKMQFIADSNAVLASLLAGDVHFTVTNAIFLQQAVVLKREWSSRAGGEVLVIPTQWRRADMQHRPEYASPPAIRDVLVRRALSHAIDRDALNVAVFEGEGVVTDTPIPSSAGYYPTLDRSIAKYPHDERRTQQLMGEAGFSKGADGVFVGRAGDRFSLEAKENATADLATELSIIASALRGAGFDVRETLVPLSQANDGELRGTFPAMYVGGGGIGERGVLPNYIGSTIPSSENRWVGRNRGGWSNAEYDRLFDAFSTTLDRSERDRQVVRMAQILSEEVPAISLYFNPIAVAKSGAVDGPRPYTSDGLVTWNISEWQWR